MENCCWFVFTVFFWQFLTAIFRLSVLENSCRGKVKTKFRLIGHRDACFNQITQIWVVTCHQYGISALVIRCHFLGTPVVASWSVAVISGYRLKTLSKTPPLHLRSKYYTMSLQAIYNPAYLDLLQVKVMWAKLWMYEDLTGKNSWS